MTQIGRDPGLCASAIMSPDPHVVLDARTDPRTLANPLVAGEFGLRFYAGVPLRTEDGHNLGTLCVIDREPRPVSQDQIEDLKDLASVVMDQLELRISARRAVAQALAVHGDDPDADHVADGGHVVGALDVAVGHLADVDEPDVLQADLDEGAEIDHV